MSSLNERDSNYETFVFYGSWRESLEGFKEDFGEEYAKEVLWNLMTVGTTGEIETDKKSIIGFLAGSIIPNINKAKDRYAAARENGKKGGRPTKEIDLQKAKELRDSGMSYEKIGKELGVSKDTIRNKLKDFSEKAKNLEKEIDIEFFSDSCSNEQQSLKSGFATLDKFEF